eukprot:316477_1
MKLQLLDKDLPGGQCLDGSPAGFYYSPPPSGTSNLWIIQLQGGGACHDKESCLKRANGTLGSSKNWPATKSAGGVLSDNARANPDFYSGHHAYLPYCSGDVWMGQRITPSTDPDTWGLYFSGHFIFVNIMEYLEDNLNALDAKYVLLTGGSAGGLGTFMNINWLYYELAEQGNYGDNITVKAAPVAGWFTAGNTTDQLDNPMMPPNDYPHWVQHENGGEGHNDSIMLLWNGYLTRACVEGLGGNNSWHCGSVHNLFPYIDVPVFVMENKFDTNQLEAQFGLPTNVVNETTTGYVEYFGVDMDRSIITQLVDNKNTKHGLFYASCFDHGGGLTIGKSNVTTIDGYNGTELLGDWFWERNKLPHFVYDTCNDEKNQLPCNPTCDSYPPK